MAETGVCFYHVETAFLRFLHRARPVIQVKASLTLPDQIDQQVALCRDRGTPTVCFNVTICFNATSKHFKGSIGILKVSASKDLVLFSSFDSTQVFRIKKYTYKGNIYDSKSRFFTLILTALVKGSLLKSVLINFAHIKEQKRGII